MIDPEALIARKIVQLKRFGHDKYNNSYHPLVQALQLLKYRDGPECVCAACIIYWKFAEAILTYLESLPYDATH